MYRNTEEEIQHLHKKIIMFNILGFPGPVLFGLGLYGLFGAEGNAFIPMLNNLNIVYSCIAIGAIIMIWEFIAIIPLLKRRSEIARNKNI